MGGCIFVFIFCRSIQVAEKVVLKAGRDPKMSSLYEHGSFPPPPRK